MAIKFGMAVSIVLVPLLFAQGQKGPVRIAPEVVAQPETLGVGRCVPDLMLTDVSGAKALLSKGLSSKRALVIVVRDTGCPLCKRYGPRLARLETRFAEHVEFLYLNCTEHNTVDSMTAEQKKYGLRGRYVVDRGGADIGRLLGIRSTAEVLLLDKARTIRYRGAVDDQYGIGYAREEVRSPLLVSAIESLLAGREISVAATTAPGCVLDLGPGRFDSEPPTYHNRISRIVQRSCLGCHRTGTAGSPPLESYIQVKGNRAMIKQVVEQKIMPPWFADDASGPWLRQYPFSDVDRKDLVRWIAAGAPEGDPKDAPVARDFPDKWNIGKPDLVVSKHRPFPVPAEGVIDYQYTFIKNPLDVDHWVQSVEIIPSAPQVVHHVLLFLEEPQRKGETEAQHRERTQDGLSGYFAALVPGMGVTEFAPGHAKLLPAGAWLKVQTHYTTSGEAQDNTTRVGFKFAAGPPRYTVRTNSVYNDKFEIPAGASNHEVRAAYTFENQSNLLSFSPHMHLRGKAFKYELVYPDGKTRLLLNIERYDFNWQLRYVLEKPIVAPRGSRLEATAWFDNSAGNPANPDPEKPVGFGLQTWDEMMVGYFDWYLDES